jgi:zinc transport system permease protein
MTEFLHALVDPDFPFMRYALLTGLLASVSFGIVGTYVVARRITYTAGAIAHCVLAGIGIARFLQVKASLPWLHPIHGAVASALAAALIIGAVSLYAREREDTIIGAVWAVGMAVGLLFLAATPGYVDPMSYFWGDILIISRSDLWLILIIDGVVVGSSLMFYNRLVAVCFDEEFARLRGVRTEAYSLLLLCLTALSVVLFAFIVGIVMVIALLVLPAAAAGHLSRRIPQMMVLAIGFCMAYTTLGLGVSYACGLRSGPTIIVVGGAVYFAVLAGCRIKRRGIGLH